MDEVDDALSRLGLVGAGRCSCRKRETFSSVGKDGAVLRVVLGAMEDVGLLVEEGLDKRFQIG